MNGEFAIGRGHPLEGSESAWVFRIPERADTEIAFTKFVHVGRKLGTCLCCNRRLSRCLQARSALNAWQWRSEAEYRARAPEREEKRARMIAIANRFAAEHGNQLAVKREAGRARTLEMAT